MAGGYSAAAPGKDSGDAMPFGKPAAPAFGFPARQEAPAEPFAPAAGFPTSAGDTEGREPVVISSPSATVAEDRAADTLASSMEMGTTAHLDSQPAAVGELASPVSEGGMVEARSSGQETANAGRVSEQTPVDAISEGIAEAGLEQAAVGTGMHHAIMMSDSDDNDLPVLLSAPAAVGDTLIPTESPTIRVDGIRMVDAALVVSAPHTSATTQAQPSAAIADDAHILVPPFALPLPVVDHHSEGHGIALGQPSDGAGLVPTLDRTVPATQLQLISAPMPTLDQLPAPQGSMPPEPQLTATMPTQSQEALPAHSESDSPLAHEGQASMPSTENVPAPALEQSVAQPGSASAAAPVAPVATGDTGAGSEGDGAFTLQQFLGTPPTGRLWPQLTHPPTPGQSVPSAEPRSSPASASLDLDLQASQTVQSCRFTRNHCFQRSIG